MPRMSSIRCELDFDSWRRARRASGTVTLSFIYRAYCRVVQLIRLIGRRDTDLAIEVVILRHEVAVLRRRCTARRWNQQIERCWPDWHDCSPVVDSDTSSSRRQPCWVGSAISSPSTGPTRTPGQVDRLSQKGPPPWYSASRRRTRTGATAASTANSPPRASSSPPRASGRSSSTTASTHPRESQDRPGRSSSPPRRKD